MNKVLLLALVMVLCSLGQAHAVTVDIMLGLTGSDETFSFGGVLHPDEVLAGNPNLVLNNNAVIVSPPLTLVNYYIKPTGAIFGGSYLAVFGLDSPGQATFTLAPNQHHLGFTWGTIDTYNTLLLTDSRGVTYTITGTDILDELHHPVAGTSQANVILNDPFGAITTAVFESSGNSFEVANLMDPASPVPLPASLPLLMAALAGLWFMGRRHGQQAI